jgi:hypothetical protein
MKVLCLPYLMIFFPVFKIYSGKLLQYLSKSFYEWHSYAHKAALESFGICFEFYMVTKNKFYAIQ